MKKFLALNQVKSDIEYLKWLFQIEYDGGIWGKYTCVQLIAVYKELSNCKTTVLFCLVLGKKRFYLPAQSCV